MIENKLFKKYVLKTSKKGTPNGDLANDILRDKEFSYNRDDNEIFRYLSFKIQDSEVRSVLKIFKRNYNSWKRNNK